MFSSNDSGFSFLPAFLLGMVVGAGLMYALDPDQGQKRRRVVRNKAFDLAGDAQELARKKADELRSQAEGLMAQARALVGR